MSQKDRTTPSVPWGVDPAALTALRLHKTREAFLKDDLATVVVEAEELLQDDPENPDALALLGDAELELGHGREAELVFEKLCGLAPDDPAYRSGLAIARFLSTDFEGALDAARAVLQVAPDRAEAHAYAGLALERLDRADEAAPHLARASALDPQAFPPAVPPEQVPWDALLREALALLPEPAQAFYRAVPVVWHRFPDPAVLRSTDPPLMPMALALYEGVPPEPPDPDVLPRSIRIYKGNCARFAHDLPRLVEDLARALASEAGDWLGHDLDGGEE